jgi:diguanylate cyclase (GGDEF)-like protein
VGERGRELPIALQGVHNLSVRSRNGALPGVHSSATGMAASDPNPRSDRLPPGEIDCPTAAALHERLEEEISRAERQGTPLSCLLVVIENLDEIAREHGADLREQTLEYVARALRRELRRFDRIGRGGRASDRDLLIILPGSDGPRGEIVARRALERLRTIKVEAGGTRLPLHVSVGLASWREDASAATLLASARAAGHTGNDETGPVAPEDTTTPPGQATQSAVAHASGGSPRALGRAGRS